MLRLSACIEMLYRDLPVEERIGRVAAQGLPAIEFWSWTNKDLAAVARAARTHRLAIAGFSYAYQGGIVDPAHHPGFAAHFDGVLRATQALDCRTVIVTVGQELPEVPRPAQHDAIVAALRDVGSRAQEHGVTLVVEPLNVLIDHRGYYLSTSVETFQIIDEVDNPAVRALFDVYHQQITEGNLINTISANIARIGHFHIADNPGRHEPGTGEINYANVLRRIDDLGYAAYVGLEFRPRADPDEALRRTTAFAGLASTS